MSAPDPRRRMNDDRRRLFGAEHREIAFVCECGDPDCRSSVVLTPGGYDERRPEPILHPLHAAAAASGIGGRDEPDPRQPLS